MAPKKPKPVPPPAVTAPGGGAKPMPHADSPSLVASSDDTPSPAAVIVPDPPQSFSAEITGIVADWTCPVDGQFNQGVRCTTCGTVAK